MAGCCSTPLFNRNTSAVHLDDNTDSKVETEYHVEKSNVELSSIYQGMINKFEDNKQTTNVVIFKRRLSRVVSSVIVSDPTCSRSLSLNSLREAANELQFLNNKTKYTILKQKEDVMENPELLSFVKDYVESSSRTVKFFETIKSGLENARNIESTVQDAIFCFQEKNYVSTVQKLMEFAALGDPFTNELIDELQSISVLHNDMFIQLQSKKLELDNKFRKLKGWKRLWTIVYHSAFAMTLICSVVLAAVSAPPAAVAAVAATATAFETIGQCFDAIWKHYQDLISHQQNIVGIMGTNTGLQIKELHDIRALVNSLQQQVGNIQKTSEFGLEEEDEIKVKLAMHNIEKKVKEFSKMMKDLDIKVDKCTQNVSYVNEQILKVITGEDKDVKCKEILEVCSCCCF